MPAAVAPQWRGRRRQVFQSVFQTEVSPPTPRPTPNSRFATPGEPFGAHPLISTSARRSTPEPSRQTPTHPLFPAVAAVADDQVTYDGAWRLVTAHIALPSSATADDSFGTLAAESQQSSARREANIDFHDAFALVVNAKSLLPRATHTADLVAWHVAQVRAHFAQHVIPLLAGCVDDEPEASRGDGRGRAARKGNYYEKHMVMVMSSIRTLEAALRLYSFGLNQLLSGFSRLADGSPDAANEGEWLNARFRGDIHALVSNSTSDGLIKSVRVVLVRLASTILGIPNKDESAVDRAQLARPAPPGPNDLRVTAARKRLLELVQQLRHVGLAGERFQVLFAEVMDAIMSAFVTGAYAGAWSPPDTRSFGAAMDTVSRSAPLSAASPCIMSLNDWVENHFARLSCEVLACISPVPRGPMPVSLADLNTYQSLALGRLAALRIEELFDIVLAWPASRPALDDLRATITTAARRKQLTDSFARTLQTRLLHPGCSTLDILHTYISIIRTLHALDHSKVLLSHVEPSLQLYLCQREDAIRVVVSGLLSSTEDIRAARKFRDTGKRHRERRKRLGEGDANWCRVGPFSTPVNHGPASKTPAGRGRRDSSPGVEATPEPTKTSQPPRPTTLVELALLLNDPSQTRRAAPEPEEDLDWNDMNWVPDPVDAGANYKRPKSEDVIGTLISALGSADVFIKEFSAVVAERLLGDPARFDQELRVLDLLKRRFGEPALQNCDVMIKDVQDSRRVDAAISRTRRGGPRLRALETPDKAPRAHGGGGGGGGEGPEMDYHARILSRLFWPNLDREHFLVPPPIEEQQRRYEKGYESLKSGRKLTWLKQLGQARVELELRDRTVEVDCTPVEATVIYAFQDPDADDDGPPARRTAEELYMQLQMDEDLVAAALHFWVAQGVLRRVAAGSNEYVVAETLAAEPTPTTATATATETATATATATATQPPDEPEQDDEPSAAARAGMSARERERREIYWRYIQGMLTNASATMPLGQMAMMMKMLIADGFAWGNEELQEFLAERVAAGEMEVVGGKYRLVRK
ncbi:hypothetical protein BT67DRAFT_387350 [Trichocladium antarcticum]|uniref:Anaphase-promoting complex subunit 2 n=1 Tax=Trichocladium antarcticum TaxID=1450529 RepID=A0AAN6ZAD9_9PEZI|nr:hypothetical protein BT67DRAFT_387350 [Trichocladium antarcticum]